MKKSKVHEKTKKDNQYQFEGFYDRLKQIDVKHAHASLNELAFKFDHLQTLGEDDEQDDIGTSNFI